MPDPIALPNGGINLPPAARAMADPRYIVDTPDFIRANAAHAGHDACSPACCVTVNGEWVVSADQRAHKDALRAVADFRLAPDDARVLLRWAEAWNGGSGVDDHEVDLMTRLAKVAALEQGAQPSTSHNR